MDAETKPTYGWTGWSDGEDCEPPEPGKKWISIGPLEDDGSVSDETAIIVLRNFDILPPERIAEAEAEAARIVAALNAYDEMSNGRVFGFGFRHRTPGEGVAGCEWDPVKEVALARVVEAVGGDEDYEISTAFEFLFPPGMERSEITDLVDAAIWDGWPREGDRSPWEGGDALGEPRARGLGAGSARLAERRPSSSTADRASAEGTDGGRRSTYERKVYAHAAYDRRDPDPKKNYGVHPVDLCFDLVGERAAICWSLSTGWHLPSVVGAAEGTATDYRRALGLWDRDGASIGLYPLAMELHFHSNDPHPYGRDPAPCDVIGGECWSDTSYRGGEPLLLALVTGGTDALFAAMEERLEAWLADTLEAGS